MHHLYRDLVIMHNRVYPMSILHHKVTMRHARVVTGKHGMETLLFVIKEAVIKS